MYPNLKLIVCEEKDKYKGDKPHDKLFKQILNDKQELEKFLFNYIGYNLKGKKVERVTNSFISKTYKSYEADIVYKVKDEQIYFLIEQQSKVDKDMVLRMLNYVVEIINIDKNNDIGNKYPLVIPIVIYTGNNEWKAEKELSRTIEESNSNEKYIEMKYELVDVNKYEEDELIKIDTVISYIMLIEKNKTKGLKEVIKKICEVSKNEEVNKKLIRIIKYIFLSKIDTNEEEIIKKLGKECEGNMKTLQDYLNEEWDRTVEEGKQEGKQEGIKEGKKEGKKEERKTVILKMIQNKLSIEDISKYTGIKKEEIEEIAKDIA